MFGTSCTYIINQLNRAFILQPHIPLHPLLSQMLPNYIHIYILYVYTVVHIILPLYVLSLSTPSSGCSYKVCAVIHLPFRLTTLQDSLESNQALEVYRCGDQGANYSTVGALAWPYKVLRGLSPFPNATFDLSPVRFDLRGQPASYFLISLPCTCFTPGEKSIPQRVLQGQDQMFVGIMVQGLIKTMK